MTPRTFAGEALRFLIGIGFTLGLRQLALLLVLPFIAIYGQELAGSTPALIGLALGMYGLLSIGAPKELNEPFPRATLPAVPTIV